MYFLKTCKKPFNHLDLILELGSQIVFQNFCVQDLMGRSEIMAALRNAALTLVSGAEPTLSVPGLHPPIPQTAGATILAPSIMCLPPALSVPPNNRCSHLRHHYYMPARVCKCVLML